jgi:hypothetical protein
MKEWTRVVTALDISEQAILCEADTVDSKSLEQVGECEEQMWVIMYAVVCLTYFLDYITVSVVSFFV